MTKIYLTDGYYIRGEPGWHPDGEELVERADGEREKAEESRDEQRLSPPFLTSCNE